MSVAEYASLYDKYGSKYGVDPKLIAAVVTKESRGNPYDTSSAGAQGLMQITPDTWATVQSNLGEPPGNVWDPEDNIRYGTRYLKYLKDTYGSTEAALAAYNAGPGTWENSGFNLNRMPTETRDYVPEVMSYYSQYTNGAAYDTAYPSSECGPMPTEGSVPATKEAATNILTFAKFAESLAFLNSMQAGFERGMEMSLDEYLRSFMKKFYHSLLYIPTLKNNMSIVVKPETLFVDPPSCNVVYPSFRTSGSFTRSPKSEPTRVLLVTDPVSQLMGGGSSSVLTQYLTISFIDYEGEGDARKEVVRGLSGIKELNATQPMTSISEYEKENGVRTLRTAAGADLYLYLLSGGKTNDVKVSGTKDKVKAQVIGGNISKDDVAQTMKRLAEYMLLRTRYEARPGSMQLYFNPYIVPGFPMVNIESSRESSLNVWGYVTDVTHHITERGWSTTASYTATHIDKEVRPKAFPIVEEEYEKSIADTYKGMLGDNVTPVSDVDGVNAARKYFAENEGSVSKALEAVWRPLTTMEEHLDQICDGANAVDQGKYLKLINGQTKFFDENIQSKIEGYSRMVYEGMAFNESDVR